MTGHDDCLIDICLQAYPVEDGYQGAESALEPFNHTTVFSTQNILSRVVFDS